MKKQLLFSAIFLLGSFFLNAQETGSLLDAIGEKEDILYIDNTFKSPRVINSHSVEMLGKGVLDFRILHRFGPLKNGLYEMFGLDQASMRMSFDYGITDHLTVGVARSTMNKEFDVFGKYRILQQSTGGREMPFSLVWASGVTINTLKDPFSGDLEPTFARRLAFYHQLMVGRKFSDAFSLQVSPVLVHRNVTLHELDPNLVFGLELGARYKITNRFALVVDYVHGFNRYPDEIGANPLSVGVDIETGGHVFQLHVSNARGMNEKAFITDNNDSWLKGDFMFGFNLSRVFQLH